MSYKVSDYDRLKQNFILVVNFINKIKCLKIIHEYDFEYNNKTVSDISGYIIVQFSSEAQLEIDIELEHCDLFWLSAESFEQMFNKLSYAEQKEIIYNMHFFGNKKINISELYD